MILDQHWFKSHFGQSDELPWGVKGARQKAQFLVNQYLLQIVKIGASTFHDETFLSSFFEHFQKANLQGLEMCSFKQQPCMDLQI